MFRLDSIKADTARDIGRQLKEVLSNKYADLFKKDKCAAVLIKPNLNSNMNALTGNTTDMRLMATVIEFLKDNGYGNITVAEGTNSGFYRNKISVISRLGVDRLAAYYGVSVKDLNYSAPVFVNFENGVKAGVARECIEAEIFINMPKLKTHFEAGMSVCLKNLMGCLVGQENKKKTHQSLAHNILNINKGIKPHLHIIDAIISMEGLGPTRGTPLRTGRIFVGIDAYLLDLACAKFASFDYRKVRTLAEAERRGMIDERHHRFVDGLEFGNLFNFRPPEAGPLATFIHSPKRQKYFLAVRNTRLLNYVCSTEVGGKLLYKTGLRQDVFIEDDMDCQGLTVEEGKCSRCGKCSDYCPVALDLPDDFHKKDILKECIGCLYCFCVCPEKAIQFHGELGFMKEQLKQYDKAIREIA